MLFVLLSIVDCGTLNDPANGMVSDHDTNFNSTANYSCNTGYTLTGDDVRTCLECGLWSGIEPTCVGEYGVIIIQMYMCFGLGIEG